MLIAFNNFYLDNRKVILTIEDLMAKLYIKYVWRVQRGGPYSLPRGWSVGGILLLEIARQLCILLEKESIA